MKHTSEGVQQLTGAEIKAIRQKYALSQQEFGARLGVTHAHISKIESGKEKPSETLLRLIKYEFKVEKLLGAPPATESRPRIERYLEMLKNLTLNQEKSDNSLYFTEFMLEALVNIYLSTNDNEVFQELLLESLSGIIDEVAAFICNTPPRCSLEDATVLRASRFTWLQRETESCLTEVLKLLHERV